MDVSAVQKLQPARLRRWHTTLVYNRCILPIMRSFFSLGLLLPLILFAQVTPTKKSPRDYPTRSSDPVFKDVTTEAGLTVSHVSTPEKKYIVESMSGGAGFIDCDNDGKLDIITVNGSPLIATAQGGDPMITLYHQDANLKFTDITKTPASPERLGHGRGRR